MLVLSPNCEAGLKPTLFSVRSLIVWPLPIHGLESSPSLAHAPSSVVTPAPSLAHEPRFPLAHVKSPAEIVLLVQNFAPSPVFSSAQALDSAFVLKPPSKHRSRLSPKPPLQFVKRLAQTLLRHAMAAL